MPAALSLTACTSTDVVGDAGALVLDDSAARFPVGLHMQVLEDESRELTIDDITSAEYVAAFKPITVPNPNFGFSRARIWLRIPVRNAAAAPADWNLSQNRNMQDLITVYQPLPGGGYEPLAAGLSVPYSQWPAQFVSIQGTSFPLRLAPGETQTLYVSLENEGRIRARFDFARKPVLRAEDNVTLSYLAIVFGGLFVLLLFNFMLGVWQQDSGHLLLSVFIVATALRMSMSFADRLLWPDVGGRFDILSPVTIAIYAIVFLIFTIQFLNINVRAPRQYRVLLLLIGIFGLTLLAALPGGRRFVTIIQFLLLPLSFGFAGWVAIRLGRQGDRDARNFFWAALPLVILGSMETLSSFRFAVPVSIGENLFGPGIVLTALLLSLVLAERVNQSRLAAVDANSQLSAANRRLDDTMAQLEQERARFAAILNDQVEAVGRFEPDGRIIFANRAFAEYRGETVESIVGLYYQDFTTADNQQLINQTLARLTPEQPIRELESDSPNSRGEVRRRRATIRGFFDENGKLVGVQSTSRDVTTEYLMDQELRRGREELERTRAQYAAILNDQTEGICRYRPDGTVLFANPAFCDLYGGTPETRIGAMLYDLMPTDSVFAVRAMTAALSPEQPIIIAERQFTDEDGRSVWRRYTIRGFFGADGKPLEYQSTTIDMTEQRMKDEELRRYRDELEHLVAERTQQLEAANAQLLRQTRVATSLRRIAYILNSSLDSRSVFRAIIDEIRKARPRDVAFRILLIREKGIVILNRSSDLGDDVELVDREAAPAHPSSVVWPALQAIRTGQLVVINDPAELPAEVRQDARLTWRSVVAVPLRAGDTLLGSMVLASQEPHAYQQEDVEMLRAFADHASLAIINAQLYEQSKELAAAAERDRLSRDLHDSVTQTLFSASIIAQTLPLQIERDPASTEAGLEKLSRLTQGALSEMRMLLAEMRPLTLLSTDLKTLLGYLAAAVMARSSIKVEIDVTGEAPPMPDDVHVAIYRVAQEALNNVVKHSDATICHVSLGFEPDGLTLTIVDDGRGFDPEATNHGTLGMLSMRERAQGIGGLLTISSDRGRGTVVSLVWGRDAVIDPSGDGQESGRAYSSVQLEHDSRPRV